MNEFNNVASEKSEVELNEKQSKKIFSKPIIWFVIAFIVIVLSFNIVNTLTRNHRIKTELTAIAENYGLKDVKIHIGHKISGYDFYDVTVDSSNLESFSYERMYNLDNAMNSDDAHISKYTCGTDYYYIYPITRSIYKNGVEIHDDYYNSESYKSVVAKENKKSKYNSSNNSGTSSAASQNSNSSSRYSSSYKSSSKKDSDPYNAKKYRNEEDFYYDHYDDFFDYYDAEDYYREHND